MILRAFFAVFSALLCLAAGLVQAQQYRWTDARGEVRYGDTPPPAGAKNVQKLDVAAPRPPVDAQVPYELARLQKDFPVKLYTSPNCKEGCEQARAALNRRGVPFAEVQVWNPETNDELKRVSGAAEVPTLMVGRSTNRGFEQGAFDALLDSAGYPRAGILPALSQKTPAAPEGYVAADAPQPVAKPVATDAPKKSGPYDTSNLQGPPPKPGPYDPTGLQGPAPKPGAYGIPSETK